MECDICSTKGLGTIVRASQFSDAVQKGFDPFKNGCMPEDMVRMASPEYREMGWALSAIGGATSHSDWNVCARCMTKLSPYLSDRGAEAPIGEAVKHVTIQSDRPSAQVQAPPATSFGGMKWIIGAVVAGMIYGAYQAVEKWAYKGTSERHLEPKVVTSPANENGIVREKGIFQDEYQKFSKWGLSFKYPKEWQEHPADIVAMMKKDLKRELRGHNRDLQEFTVITGPNGGTALLVMKYTTPIVMTPSKIDTALRFMKHTITKVMKLEDNQFEIQVNPVVHHGRETILANLPAVEDYVRLFNVISYPGRGSTYMIIDGRSIFEISFLANSSRKLSEASTDIYHLTSSMKVEGK